MRVSDVGSAAAAQEPTAAPSGIARLSKLAFDGVDLMPLWRELVDKFIAGDDPAALMDLATLEQLFGRRDSGLARQADALAITRLYRSPTAAPTRLTLLAFAAPGDIGANTPLEFLLEDSEVALHTLYILPGKTLPEIPAHDLAFVAVGESDENRRILEEIARFAASWPRLVLNPPQLIAGLSRERLWSALQRVPGLLVPPTMRVGRADLARLAAGEIALSALLPQSAFPIIARPVDSHAGQGLLRLDSAAAAAAYLAERREREFYLSPFVDYRSADGLYRKYRVVFVEGRPYACHMAIAEQWMIYYLNAGMKESAAKRAEEERFMRDFDTDFARRHEAALAGIAEQIGLDYFAIDCAEMPDGRLLLFEADIAMIVHAMDPPEIYPYKPPQMRKLFAAFRAMLRRRAGLEQAAAP